MLGLKLKDMTLLSCSFEQKFDGYDEEAFEESGYPEEQILLLSIESTVDEQEAAAFIEGKLEDERLPFSLTYEMAFLFSIPEGEEVPPAPEVEPTLVWLAFPFMRELVADVTGRSPSDQYFLPPLTRLPKPTEIKPPDQAD